MRKYFVSDFNVIDVPTGGGEWVDDMIIQKFNLEFLHTRNISSFDPNAFYVFSNISLLPYHLVRQISSLNYVIMEHDYKICVSRHPWRYPDNLIPQQDRINYDIYENAKAVFVQTTDHMNVFLKNNVKANFINLECSLWSDDDLELLSKLYSENKEKNGKYAVYYTNNWIKNTQGNLKYCSDNNLPVHILKENRIRTEFLSSLSKCSGIVFYPLARETFCRLVVESKCLGLNIITSKNYGASLESWFDRLNGEELIDFLKEKTKINLENMFKFI